MVPGYARFQRASLVRLTVPMGLAANRGANLICLTVPVGLAADRRADLVRLTSQWVLPLTDALGFLVFGRTLSHALPGTASRDLRLQPAAFAWLKVKGVLFCIRDNSLTGDLTFETSNCTFNALVIVNLYSCHSIPPKS